MTTHPTSRSTGDSNGFGTSGERNGGDKPADGNEAAAGHRWRPPRWSPPPWLRTVRVRLTLTYSALVFGIAALLLAGVYVALSQSVQARPLDPVTVKKFEKNANGIINYRTGEDFQAADITNVQEYVNYTTLQTLRTYSAIALAFLFVLSLAIGWWVAGRALRPIERITSTAREISATDLSRRIAATGPQDELRTLADTVDDMLARIESAFAAQRALVDDVSHELRNPIAVVQTNVDAVLSRDDVTVHDRAHATAVVTRATRRMGRLVEDLLATARSRSGAFVDERVDLPTVAATVVEEFRILAAGRGLDLLVRLNPGPVVIADAAALTRALTNIVSNAVRLAPNGTAITVAAGSTTGWAWVAVSDEGPGIDPRDQQRVFERFGRTSTGEQHDGHGLGLAIARQVVEAHEGRITLFSDSNQGSTFVVWLPDRTMEPAPERGSEPPQMNPLTVNA